MMICIDDLKSPETLGEYQTNMTQYILDCLEFMNDLLDYLNRSATNEKQIKMYSKVFSGTTLFLKRDNYNILKIH